MNGSGGNRQRWPDANAKGFDDGGAIAIGDSGDNAMDGRTAAMGDGSVVEG
jgi:hypothetical protein